jgi:DNA-binding CsgD family transcriptional regulator
MKVPVKYGERNYLTKKELEILTLINLEKSRKEIAELLTITIGTLMNYMKNIRYILNAHNDFQIIIEAKKRNLI